MRQPTCGILLAAAAMWHLLPSCGAGVEPAAEYVQALRERGYYDMALDYLDRMADSPLVTLEFKETILYQKGITLIEGSRLQRDVGLREQQLDQAQEALQEFLNTRIDHELTDACKSQLGSLMVERGRTRIERSKKSANPQPLLKEARELYDQAYAVFATAQNDLKEQLENPSLKGVLDERTEQDKIARRNLLRTQYLEAQLLSAAVLEESADTVGNTSSPQYTELLTKAADEYSTIYEKYRTRIAGSYALMYKGRCFMKMGKHKDALSFFTELLAQPDEDAFRTLKIKTMNYAMECWMAEEKLAEALSKGSALVADVRPNESRTLPWLELRVKVVRAAKEYIELLRKTKPKDPQIRTITAEARKLADFVSQEKSEYQSEARRLLAELRGLDPDDVQQEAPDPKTFAEAKEAGSAVLDEITTANLVLKMVPPRLQREKDEQTRAELQQQIRDAQEKVDTLHAQARQYFELALGLVTPETNVDDVNVVRYFLCYLMYKEQEYPEAAVIGEFVATRYPNSAGARQCAKIALASYLTMYSREKAASEKAPDTRFEADRIVAVSQFILDKWPQQPEAEDAVNALIPFMIRAGELQPALDYVRRIPEQSARRGEAELQVGRALWGEYVTRVNQRRAAHAASEQAEQPLPPDPQLQQLRVEAETVLADGISRMEKSGVTETLVTAALALAQIYVDSGQATRAVELLEHESYGVIELTNNGHEATKLEGVAEDVYKIALRAYIGSLAEGGDPAPTMAKAKEMMAGLKSTVSDDAEGQKSLVRIYVTLAQSLQQQIELADPQAKLALSDGFETFLKQVRQEAAEFSVLNWVAETFRNSLGKANLGTGGRLTDESQRYYQEAVATYEKILELADQSDFLPTEKLKPHLSMQLALTQRDLQKFTAAMDVLVELLKENPRNVSVQIEAANTYQLWAGFDGKEDLYNFAIGGAKPNAQKTENLVWGWGKLARLTAGNDKFDEIFYQARLNLATCRYKLAIAKKGVEKTETLKKAKNDIALTYRLYPGLGGETQRAEYDKLLRLIQGQLGDNTVGLQALAPTSSKDSSSGSSGG